MQTATAVQMAALYQREVDDDEVARLTERWLFQERETRVRGGNPNRRERKRQRALATLRAMSGKNRPVPVVTPISPPYSSIFDPKLLDPNKTPYNQPLSRIAWGTVGNSTNTPASNSWHTDPGPYSWQSLYTTYTTNTAST